MLEATIWWTGALVLVSGALAFAVALFALLVGGAVMFGTYYAKRLGVLTTNLRDVVAWVENGRPTWRQGTDNVFRMVPTNGKWESYSTYSAATQVAVAMVLATTR